MGISTPPPKVQPAPPRVQPTSMPVVPPAGEGDPKSRLKLPEKQIPMGPSGWAILGSIVAIGIGIHLWTRIPTKVPMRQLQLFVGGDVLTLDWGSAASCPGRTGCLAVYLGTDKDSQKAVAGALALADAIEGDGVHTLFIIGQDSLKSCAKLARSLQRQAFFDPQGDWAKDAKLEHVPAWIVYTPAGVVKRRSSAPLSATDVTGALAP